MRKMLLATALWMLVPPAVAEITLDLGTGRAVLDEAGRLTQLNFGKNTSSLAGFQPVMMIETDDGERHPKSMALERDRLTVSFEGGGMAEWSIARHPGFVLLRLVKLSCDRPVKRMRLFALPVPEKATVAHTLNAAHAGDWTVAVLATSLNVEARPGQLEARAVPGTTTRPAPSTPAAALIAQTHQRHGIEPAGVAIVACPTPEWPATVERVEIAAGLPSPRPGGEWNKRSPWIHRSYLFLTDFRDSQFEEALALARRGGFHMILLGQESWCETTGHYQVNRERFPDGVEGLRRTVGRFHDAGFKVGLHLLAASIYPPDPYLTPVPDHRLVKDASATLAADLDEKTDSIPVTAAPEAFPAEDGGYLGPGAVLQIGNELIFYATRNMQAPFGFAKCQRGHLGTKAAPHPKGEKVAHVLKAYGYFLFDMDTSILPEIAENFARVANACNVDMLYFDGSERLQGDHWYYNALLHKTIYDKLANKNTLLQASSFSHYSWHLLARTASADGHGDIKGYLDERSVVFDSYARDGMPLDIGWYYGYDPAATPDLFEYVLGATVGYDASMSFQVSLAAAHRHPFTGEILDLISGYEHLRLSGRVPPEMRQRLRIDPALGGQLKPAEREARLGKRREYRLVGADTGGQAASGTKAGQAGSGAMAFQRVAYEPWHEVSQLDGQGNAWKVHVGQASTRCGVQLHVLPGPWLRAGPAYSSLQAVTLESFEDSGSFEGPDRATRDGVTQSLESSTQGARDGTRFAVYRATSSAPALEGWSYMGRQFDPPLDISWHKGIGFWMRGDGRGGAFKVQLRDDKGATDYYVQNDFEGWRYQQLPRPAVDPIDYRNLRYLGLYYNGLPANTTVTCGVDGIKALAALDRREIVDPWVELAGRRWTWKGTLEEGQFLFFWPGEPIRRYGQPLSEPEISPGKAENTVLDAGDHQAAFGCGGELVVPVSVRVTLQPPERHAIQ